MAAIADNAKMNEQRHRLMNAEDAQEWNAAEVSLQEVEMRQAMQQMVSDGLHKVQQKQQFEQQLQERRSADPHFAKADNAEHWDRFEVAHWLELSGCGYASKHFFAQQVDGNVLLHDVTREMLVASLGIEPPNSSKLMRAL